MDDVGLRPASLQARGVRVRVSVVLRWRRDEGDLGEPHRGQPERDYLKGRTGALIRPAIASTSASPVCIQASVPDPPC